MKKILTFASFGNINIKVNPVCPCSKVVEPSTHNPKIEGLNTPTDIVRENGEKNYFNNYCNGKHTQMDRQTDESKHKWTGRPTNIQMNR